MPNNLSKIAGAALTFSLLTGCVSPPPDPQTREADVSQDEQASAQQEIQPREGPGLGLKHRLAVGRLSNETNYGRSLLGNQDRDQFDRKIADMFSQAIVNTGNFLVFERQDLDVVEEELARLGEEQDMIGVDTLVVGSLTEFGRSTTGERGFWSSSSRQEATATVDIRLVDVRSGQMMHAVSGTGSASTEQQRTLGFGSVAGYDGSLNDQAIGAAVNAAVNKMRDVLITRPWQADILAIEGEDIYLDAGAEQGITAGQRFTVLKKGQRVQSSQSGRLITLPGEAVATVEVVSTFGDTPRDQGAIARLVSGSINDYELNELVVQDPDSDIDHETEEAAMQQFGGEI